MATNVLSETNAHRKTFVMTFVNFPQKKKSKLKT